MNTLKKNLRKINPNKNYSNGNKSNVAKSMKPKTYRALRHDVVRKKQSENSNQVHHPNEKTKQVKRVLLDFNQTNEIDLKILELFK